MGCWRCVCMWVIFKQIPVVHTFPSENKSHAVLEVKTRVQNMQISSIHIIFRHNKMHPLHIFGTGRFTRRKERRMNLSKAGEHVAACTGKQVRGQKTSETSSYIYNLTRLAQFLKLLVIVSYYPLPFSASWLNITYLDDGWCGCSAQIWMTSLWITA